MKKLLLLLVLALPFGAAAAPAGWLNIQQLGAKPDGKTKCTEVIKTAIAQAEKNGGGTIYFPAGEYLTGAIALKSNITLHLEAGAVLKFSDNFDDYLPFVKMRWEGTVMNSFSPLFYAYEQENITIEGRGKIDGNGQNWWKEMFRIMIEIRDSGDVKSLNKYQKMWEEQNQGLQTSDYYARTMKLRFFRPPLFQTYECKNVRIEGVTIVNSPFWTVNPAFCDNVTVTGVTINNPPSPNTDGINPTSCRNVHISDCHISVGDDCITIKSGRDADGRKWNRPCENITITNCTMLSGHGGVVIGSEMSGSVRKVTISNCVFDGTDRGIRLKASRGRGGVVEEIRVSNIVMKNIKREAFVFNLFYDKNQPEEPVSERTPTFRNIHISNVTGSEVKQACLVLGINEMPVENLTFNNINIDADLGFEMNTARNIELHNVEVSTKLGAPFKAIDVEGLVLGNVKARTPLAQTPIVDLRNVKNAYIYNCSPLAATDIFARISGENTERVVMKYNNFVNVQKPLEKGYGVKDTDVVVE
ncbi:MAG: glycoside hydrolase family 28 protein [Prevotellaceae bacterium]|jgi:polygalacturonase|nr:glycoside hydrolase family 28 protein [Prevotellaceae bacterium]